MYGNRNFGGGQRRSGGFSPVQVGQELDVKIEAVGEKGDGIAKEKGFVLFVPGVKQGDEVRIKVSKVLRNVGFAEVVGKAEKSLSESTEEASGETQEEQADAPQEESSEEETTKESNPEDSEDFGEEDNKY